MGTSRVFPPQGDLFSGRVAAAAAHIGVARPSGVSASRNRFTRLHLVVAEQRSLDPILNSATSVRIADTNRIHVVITTIQRWQNSAKLNLVVLLREEEWLPGESRLFPGRAEVALGNIWSTFRLGVIGPGGAWATNVTLFPLIMADTILEGGAAEGWTGGLRQSVHIAPLSTRDPFRLSMEWLTYDVGYREVAIQSVSAPVLD
jgi:hypothetical protein